MSFKRREADGENGNEGISEKRQRSDEFGSSRGRGFRSRGSRGRGFNGRGGRGSPRGRGFNSRGRGGFNRFNNDGAGEDNGGRGRGRGFRGRDSGRSRGFRGGRGFNRGRGGRDGNTTGGFDKSKSRESSIKVGQDAPEFNNILNDKSESISLKQYRGKYVILFIYFKDGTYGSKLEQESFRDVQKKFEKLNAVILGVSRDNEVSHANAVKESELNYSLLADTKSVITKAYDAIDQSDRVFSSTFIISPEGKIAATWAQVYGVDKHPQEVLTKLEKIINGDTSDEKKKVTNDDEEEEEENDNDNDKEDIDVDEEENDEDNDEDNEDVEEDDDE